MQSYKKNRKHAIYNLLLKKKGVENRLLSTPY